jgi:hypothetical protein
MEWRFKLPTLRVICDVFIPTPNWGMDWAWGIPLIVLNVVIHVTGLGVMRQAIASTLQGRDERRHHNLTFAFVLGVTTSLVTVLHGFEACIWAIAYRRLGALPDFKSSMLYSLNAITSYGHVGLRLEDHWHLLGALEALNGWLLFGLTTAFLFAVIQEFGSPVVGRERRKFGAAGT